MIEVSGSGTLRKRNRKFGLYRFHGSVLIFMCRITFERLTFKSWHLLGTIPIHVCYDVYHQINRQGRAWKVEKVSFVFFPPAKWKVTFKVQVKFYKGLFPEPETCHIAWAHAMERLPSKILSWPRMSLSILVVGQTQTSLFRLSNHDLGNWFDDIRSITHLWV